MTNIKPNRDLNRQNKAATLVNAVLFSNVVNEGLETIIKLVQNTISSKDCNDVQKMTETLLAVSDISKLILNDNHTAIKKICSCSTYVKKGAIPIAHRETRIMKQAIITKEDYSLSSELRHYNKDLVQSHKSLIRISNSFLTTPSPNPSTIAQVSEPPNQSTPTITKCKEKTVITSRKKPLSKYQPLLAFILPSPLLDREQYSPYQAINVVLNNSNKSNRAILDLPKQNNRYVVRKLTKNFVIELLITKKTHSSTTLNNVCNDQFVP